MISPSLADQGWRMPAEWETHAATWMSWPSRENTSFPDGDHHDQVLPVFLEMIRALTSSERLYLNCTDPDDRAYIEANLNLDEAFRENLVITDISAVYPWCRDHGAIFIVNDELGEVAATSWKYNAWGGKYPEAFPDNNISTAMAKLLGVQEFDAGLVLEGGSIDCNGCGTVLTTESCLLNPNRNPQLDRAGIERHLYDYLGFEKVLWLHDGIVGDDTDGHIDDITRFINPETVVTVIEEDGSDPNHLPLERNWQRLRRMTTEDGSPLNIIALPMPAPVIIDGQRLPASYANFYIANSVVLLPVFDDPKDTEAIAILSECFPDRRIVPINSRELVWGLGSFHCLTQQVPAVRRQR
ncbi:MAG: agmatine deiminase family protein [Verrucomicrobiaceae bacterium]|nr:MAG: agmatine deiminase family protein [Verrucomicrobiaceae bacterium]